MLSIEPNRAPMNVRPSPFMDGEEQLDARIRQMIASHAEAHLLAKIDQRVVSRIPAAVEAACATLVATGGRHLVGTGQEAPLARLQESLAARVDMASVDAAADATVAARVDDLFRVAAKMVPAPASRVDYEGVPRRSEEEALREARGALNDPRLSSLGEGIDIDADDR